MTRKCLKSCGDFVLTGIHGWTKVMHIENMDGSAVLLFEGETHDLSIY